MITELLIWAKDNWGTVISMLALGLGVRRLEILIRHKKSSDKKALYDRLGALELEQSSQRSETNRIDLKLNDLREGCQLIETKADSAVSVADKANERSETILRVIKKK